MAKKKTNVNRLFLLIVPVAIVCLLVMMAFVAYSFTFLGVTTNYSLYDYLLDKNLLLAAGISTLVINIIAALYFLANVFVGNKTREKLSFLTTLMLIATAVANLVLSIYVCVKLGWNNIAFFGVVSYILWFALSGYALVLAMIACYKAFKK